MKICPECGDWFEPNRKFPWQRFCKEKCRREASYKRVLERKEKKLNENLPHNRSG